MKPTDIDLNFIEIFSNAYNLATHDFGDPLTASSSKQKKIRNYICNFLGDKNDYPENVLKCIDKALSDAEILTFSKECADYIEKNGTWAKQRFDKFSADLDKDAARFLWEMIQCYYPIYHGSFYKTDDGVAVNISHCNSYKCTLILKNASIPPNFDYEYMDFEGGAFTRKDDGTYTLVAEAWHYDDTSSFLTFHFTDVYVEYETFNATKTIYAETPWKHLLYIASDIYSKSKITKCLLNEEEKKLLPLIMELCNLTYCTLLPREFFTCNSFPILKSYAEKYGYDKVILLIQRLENAISNNKKCEKIVSKLITLLNNVKYEPLWREIFSQIAESQSEYPSLAEKDCPTGTLQKTRRNIQKLLEAHGYSGTYPDFYKKSSIRGLHLEEAYNMTYFVGMEKNSVHFIHCDEHFLGGNLAIEFLCGAALLRKDETADDIYSCAFNANGRRLIYTVEYNQDISEDIDQSNLAMRVGIAVKKAELKKLSKQEKQAYLGNGWPYWLLFLYIFLFAGGLFAVLFTLAFMIFAALSIFFAEGLESMLSCITDYPVWLLCFAFAWIGFGGLFGLVTVLAKRK